MLASVDSMSAPSNDSTISNTYTAVTGMVSGGYSMLAIGCLIIGLAAALRFTGYI